MPGKETRRLVALLVIPMLAALLLPSCDGTGSGTSTGNWLMPVHRGDINGDGVAYTIADAVFLSNMLVYQDITVPFQPLGPEFEKLVCDVNCDGVPGDVADLVYLTKVMLGGIGIDNLLFHEADGPREVRYTVNDGKLSVIDTVGAVMITVDGDSVPNLLHRNVEIRFHFDGAHSRILVNSFEGCVLIGAIVIVGGEILEIDFATPNGRRATPKLQ